MAQWTKNDISVFRSLNIDDLLGTANNQNYISYYSVCQREIDKREFPDDSKERKILILFSTVCSMIFAKPNLHEPFSPLWQIDGKRSYILSDFPDDDLSFLENCLPLIKNCLIRARIADMLWTRNKRQIKYAVMAVQEYLSIPLTEEYILHDGFEMWKRGIFLAKSLKDSLLDELDLARSNLRQTFLALPHKENNYGMRIIKLLFDVCDTKDFSFSVIDKLMRWGDLSSKNKSWYWARDYYDEALRWIKKHDPKNTEFICEIIYREGRCWEGEAEQRTDSAIVAGAAYADALKIYRQIPRQHRAKYNIDSKLKDLQLKMAQANQSMEAELVHIETEGVDIANVVKRAQSQMRGKDPFTALVILANINPRIKKQYLEKNTVESLQDSSLAAIVPAKYYSRDGRIVAFSPGLSGDINSPDSKQTLHCKLMQLYGLQASIIVLASILPALEIFNSEHLITENDLIDLCKSSPLVPEGRSIIWGKALFYGFKYQFLEAIHLLAPQVEHMVRTILKLNNVKTSIADDHGIENEAGLSYLLDTPGISDYIHEDVLFEIKCLLSDQPGPNLRNEIAHGLISFADANNHSAIYFWWYCLKLIINSLPIDSKELNISC